MDANETTSLHDQYSDANCGTGGLPDDVQAEMDQAFGYPEEPSSEELEAMYQQWLATQKPATKTCRCWMRDGGMQATIIIDGKRFDIRHCHMPAHIGLYTRIDAAGFEAWRGQNPTGKAFVELTQAEADIIQATAAFANAIPTLKPITSKVQMPNPANWRKAGAR